LPLADVKDLQTKTESDLSKARRSLDEEITVAAEKKQRADSFDQLYAEGVVSRRELESSKTENEKATQDLADAKSLVYNLEQKYARIEKRLAELEKAKKSSSASAKAGTKHRSKN
jgi:multidrug resistance efflux pump